MSQDIYTSAAHAYVVAHVRHLPIGVLDFFLLAQNLAEISRDHDERIRLGEPHYTIPLIWVALAQTVKLHIDFDGKIADGPHLPDGAVQP